MAHSSRHRELCPVHRIIAMTGSSGKVRTRPAQASCDRLPHRRWLVHRMSIPVSPSVNVSPLSSTYSVEDRLPIISPNPLTCLYRCVLCADSRRRVRPWCHPRARLSSPFSGIWVPGSSKQKYLRYNPPSSALKTGNLPQTSWGVAVGTNCHVPGALSTGWMPYFNSRNSLNPSGASAASSCQVITLHLVRISADLTAAIT